MKAVLFDLWNTLAYQDPEVTRAFESRISGLFRSQMPSFRIGEFKRLRKKYHVALTTGEVTFSESNRLIIKELGLGEGLLDEFSRLTTEAYLDSMRVYGGVFEVISELRAMGLKLGLVTNCGDGTINALKKVKLDVFDAYGFSNEVGVRKPDPRIYFRVVDELKVKPRECAFVSDEIYEDLVGAREFGMRTIHVRRENRFGVFDTDPDEMVIEPDAEVDDIMDVVNIIKDWVDDEGCVV